MNSQKIINEDLFAPRARFDRVYVLSPIKIASVFLASHHCVFLLLALFTAFWVETNTGYYGPLFRCEQDFFRFIRLSSSILIECRIGGFFPDTIIFGLPSTAIWLLVSLFMAISSMIVAFFSFRQPSDSVRYRCWWIYLGLLLVSLLIDIFLVVSIPLRHREEPYRFQWAYGVFCGGALFNLVAFSMAFLTVRSDDVQYIESVEHVPLH